MAEREEGDFYRDFAEAYDSISAGTPGDVEFYRDLALESGGPVVELGVGTGRVAIALTQAGVEVTGIDVEPAMLAIARQKAAAAGVTERLRLVEGDMRSFTVDAPVPLVTIPYRTFLHNLTTEDQMATLRACHRALAPDGRLALNVFNPDVRYIAEWLQRPKDEWRANLRAFGGSEVSNAYEPTAQIVRSRVKLRGRDGKRRTARLAVRYVWRYEMEHLLARTGFEVEALYGDFARGAFLETSSEMVWVARRAGQPFGAMAR